ncbi:MULTISPECIES: sigma-70 family RNA polymerase sigma factor [unclassified Kitasatospora]|uniref:sigma-70 family RNA polymerase sigma factor n=1 Tax=unclassified Kitasatospora TaxID=2633591 RepID=UPI0033CDE869
MTRTVVDAGLVVAARDGSQEALDELVGQYLPLVYNIVGRALPRSSDVDDVVQETMLRVVRGLSGLRDEHAFRSWLAAVTMNQVRRHRQSRPAPPRALDELADVADPGADFMDLTLTELGLSGQRRETVEATRWLDEDNRELLSLWWLVATGHLTRAELAAAIGLDAHHATVRVGRMKAQLDTARLLVRVLAVNPRCGELARLMQPWDGRPGALWRKRLARHARECRYCGGLGAGLVPAERLLASLALVPVPFGYQAFVLAGAEGSPAPVAASSIRTGPVSHRRVRGHGRWGRHRLGPFTKPLLAAAALTVSAAVVVGAGTLAQGPDGGAPAADRQPVLAATDAGGSVHVFSAETATATASEQTPTSSPSATGEPSPASPAVAPTRTANPPTPSTSATPARAANSPAPGSAAAPTSAANRPTAAPTYTDPPALSPEAAAAAQVFTFINQARAAQSLPPLQLSTGLQTSAGAHNRTMAAGCGLEHQCPGEADLGGRYTAAGVNKWGGGGECIGSGGPVANTVAGVTDMAVGLTKGMLAEQPPNDGHRQAILSSSYHHIGIAVMRDRSGIVWLTQDFSG